MSRFPHLPVAKIADRPTRRAFLKASLAAGVAVPAVSLGRLAMAQPKPEPGADKLTAYQIGPQVWVRWANQPLTSYRAHPTQKYPYFFPVSGPVSGKSLTSETSVPYPHHRSLFLACDKVNGANYWQTDLPTGQIFSRDLKLGKATPESVEITDRCEWNKPNEPPVMADERKFTITVVGPRLRIIDAEIVWKAVQDVTIQKTNHALFSIRAAFDLTPWGGGTLVNAQGKVGEKETFGQESEWACFYGKREGCGELVEGIALLDHPKNPWTPCKWFTRDYGFISPMPFNFIEKPWELPAGQSVNLRYRVVIFAGDPQEAQVDRIYKEWAGV